jgi:CheY-like chemotaxis protein
VALHQALLAAIERLKPPAETPTHSSLWRRYRHASLRYVEGRTVAQVAVELGISERQARRDSQDVLNAVAEALGAGRTEAPPPRPSPRPPADRRDEVDREIARVGALPPPEPVPIAALVDGVIATAARLAEGRRVAVTVRLDPALPPVRSERAALRQILLEELLRLVELGIGRHGVEVRARAGPAEVVVEISASGVAAAGARAADGERRRVADRLAGLQGVAVSRREHGDSHLVVLTLPLARPPTVLAVDDNPGLLRLIRRYLAGGEFAVHEARSAAEAVELARDVQPDVVTMDVMMPGTDGWEALQLLRAHPSTRHIPVVICSVLKERDLAMSLGAAGFVAKPVTREELLAALRRALAERRG